MDVYEALQEKLNKHPLGAPKRDEFLEILRILFTPEEAELAVHLPFAPQRAGEIAASLGRPEEEIVRLCEQMAAKTLLYSYDARGQKLYMLFPSAPGLFEFPFMKNAVSPGSLPGIDFDRLGKLWWQYHEHGWGLEMGATATPAARVIPVGRSITPELHVFAYEEVAGYIRGAKYVAISECPCRVTQHKCDAPTDVCMVLGYSAKYLAERGAARLVTHRGGPQDAGSRRGGRPGALRQQHQGQGRLYLQLLPLLLRHSGHRHPPHRRRVAARIQFLQHGHSRHVHGLRRVRRPLPDQGHHHGGRRRGGPGQVHRLRALRLRLRL